MTRLLAFAPLLLAGCVQPDDAPSLARRPIESRDLNAPPAEPAPVQAADPALRSEIGSLVDKAEAGQRSFAALLPRAETAASNAGAEGSESWVAAQQLLSALEAARTDTTSALARIDALVVEKVAAKSDIGLAELQQASERVGALADAQQASIDAVKARISR
ncbi:hypothetical protein HJG53_02520 [Sphingomonas sp. ID1715]|uniref:hypothetical protein n=1 Tax=Sphingomonas sp. ID1715 TaxID=1656898 RepID=UPI0014885AF0|nr:hypothetical protein [Sphingomonas sp. ID1715]NNM75780.1 hypothetical protein [Sphingomonas sp. ID1715]